MRRRRKTRKRARMVGTVLALLGSVIVAKAWLTLSLPDDSQASAGAGGAADGAASISAPLNVLAGAHESDDSASGIGVYFPALKFVLDLPRMFPDFPSEMLGAAPASNDLDWQDGGPVHDVLPQLRPESESASDNGASSAGSANQISYLAPQFLSPMSSGGLAHPVLPDGSFPVTVVTENVPEPGENWLIAIGATAILLRFKPRRVVPCRKEVV